MIEESAKEYTLEAESELRFEVEAKKGKVELVLKEGKAEIFGSELVSGKSFQFKCGAKIAVYTWHGCVLELRGKPDVVYTACETPMTMYLNFHIGLEKMRRTAEERDQRGPVTMVVGPCDVGKSTVCRLLLNYAVRMGHYPLFVDVDVGQGSIGIPGSIGTIVVERPAQPSGGFLLDNSLVYHYGHTSPGDNMPLMNEIVDKLASTVETYMEAKKKVRYSGVIINTCGWIRGQGYEHLLNIAKTFEVTAVLCLDQERLYNELQRDLPSFIQPVFLPKSRGVVERSKQNRAEFRDSRVNEYFYGTPLQPLYPHSFDIRLSDLKVYKIGAPSLPDSCLPAGLKPKNSQTMLVKVTPGANLLNHILAVSHASEPEEDVVRTQVAGFICVTRVDMEKGTVTVLSPQPRPLPKGILLLSEVKYVDGNS